MKSRIQVPLTETGIQYLQAGFHGLESRIQDCLGYPYVGQAATVFNVLTEKKDKKRRETKIKEKEREKKKKVYVPDEKECSNYYQH